MIRAAALLLALSASLPGQVFPKGFLSLANGRDLAGWDGDKRYWSIEDGAITGQTTANTVSDGPTYLVWRGGETADFELRGKYRFHGSDGNSGVQYRSREERAFFVTGYQADFEVGVQWSGVLVEMGGRLHLARRGQKVRVDPAGKIHVTGSLGHPDELQSLIKANDWNEFSVLADGNRLIHTINGRVMVDVLDEQADKAARRGILALQLNRSRPMKVQFRDLQLRRIR